MKQISYDNSVSYKVAAKVASSYGPGTESALLDVAPILPSGVQFNASLKLATDESSVDYAPTDSEQVYEYYEVTVGLASTDAAYWNSIGKTRSRSVQLPDDLTPGMTYGVKVYGATNSAAYGYGVAGEDIAADVSYTMEVAVTGTTYTGSQVKLSGDFGTLGATLAFEDFATYIPAFAQQHWTLTDAVLNNTNGVTQDFVVVRNANGSIASITGGLKSAKLVLGACVFTRAGTTDRAQISLYFMTARFHQEFEDFQKESR